MAVREGVWDCQYCGANGIRGRHKACGGCGRSRPAGTRFYLLDDATYVEEQELLEQARVGPDWICDFCDSSNPANLDVCYSCRAPRDAESRQQEVQSFSIGAVPDQGDNTFDGEEEAAVEESAPQRSEESYSSAITRAQPARSKRSVYAAAGAVVLLLVVCIGAFIYLNQSSDLTGTVSAVRWERTATIEQYRTVVDEGWEIPAGGRELSSSEEIREYEQVLVGYETISFEVSEQVQVGETEYVCGQRDLGNGFFEDIMCSDPVYETQYRTEVREEPVYEQEPIYGTLYQYEIERWVVDRTETTSGNDSSPYWPEITDDEQFANQQSLYWVTFETDDGQQFTLEQTESAWQQYIAGQEHTLVVNRLGEVTIIDP